jgi:hypothetical protein
MSSPDRAAAKPAKSPAKKPKVAATKAAATKSAATKSAATKSAATKAAAVKAAPVKRARKADAGEPSSQDKAAFLKALSKGIAPGTDAARTVARKSGKKGEAAAPAAAAPEAPKVEVLRRIPAPVKVVDTPESAHALEFAARIEKMVETGDLQTLQPHAQQALIAALCKLYAANTEAGERYPALGQRSAVSATDVMILCGALLKAVDLQVFELGMWQSWSST